MDWKLHQKVTLLVCVSHEWWSAALCLDGNRADEATDEAWVGPRGQKKELVNLVCEVCYGHLCCDLVTVTECGHRDRF